jgi:hypothetical protein
MCSASESPILDSLLGLPEAIDRLECADDLRDRGYDKDFVPLNIHVLRKVRDCPAETWHEYPLSALSNFFASQGGRSHDPELLVRVSDVGDGLKLSVQDDAPFSTRPMTDGSAEQSDQITGHLSGDFE